MRLCDSHHKALGCGSPLRGLGSDLYTPADCVQGGGATEPRRAARGSESAAAREGQVRPQVLRGLMRCRAHHPRWALRWGETGAEVTSDVVSAPARGKGVQQERGSNGTEPVFLLSG